MSVAVLCGVRCMSVLCVLQGRLAIESLSSVYHKVCIQLHFLRWCHKRYECRKGLSDRRLVRAYTI